MKSLLYGALAVLVLVPLASHAHSTVAPKEVTPSTYQTFTLSVPTEKDIPTTGIRLIVPEGLERITPFVKPGWHIDILKDESGENITEVRWTGGSIPAGQKDVFEFTARTPAEEMSLAWKAYQTYADSSVVAWDQEPHAEGAHSEEEVKNPYSLTRVKETVPEKTSNIPFAVSGVALSISLVALTLVLRKKSHS